ncbi:MAG TPA: hypothetical protein VMD55_06570 [Terracidiphilus sp.]|nr:hypothetical protein [Terracidiphilus sp.]
MQRRFLTICLLGAALAACAVPARADEDAVEFFHNIEVTQDAPVADAVCFFCNVSVDGKVNGDVVVFFGNVRLNGDVQGDLVKFFGNVTAADNSSVGGDLVSFFGNVRLGENVAVGQDLTCLFGDIHSAQSATVHGDRVAIPAMVLYLPVLVVGLVVWVIIYELREHRRRQLMQYPYPPPPR